MIAVDPGKPNYGSARYDKVWAAASALGLPLSMHILTRREGAGYHRLPFLMTWMGHSHPVQLSITAMLVSGVFHRFPDLRIVSVENDIGWVPHYLYKLKDAFEQFQYFIGYDLPDSPIEYFHRNVWFTFQDDPVGVQHLDMIGTHQVMWGSDYPHGDSTWPDSQENRRTELRWDAGQARSASDLRQRHRVVQLGLLRPVVRLRGMRTASPKSERYPARPATTLASLRMVSTSANSSGGISIPNS